ncbi:hypothetical protein V6N12_066685 [Hibiscus sabdariffa]|uniref:Uncharacterized protein n=1 Tax=Hibiscus sabdariffa TaxID=183260 RepID=A0ABR2BDG2_9ROSI
MGTHWRSQGFYVEIDEGGLVHEAAAFPWVHVPNPAVAVATAAAKAFSFRRPDPSSIIIHQRAEKPKYKYTFD